VTLAHDRIDAERRSQYRVLVHKCSAQRIAVAMEMGCRLPASIGRLGMPITAAGSLSIKMAECCANGVVPL
jgi:hypothetical protein